MDFYHAGEIGMPKIKLPLLGLFVALIIATATSCGSLFLSSETSAEQESDTRLEADTASGSEAESEFETEFDPDHTHTYASAWSYDADGHWHAATCGHTAEISAYASHRPDEGTVCTEATCSAEGELVYTCLDCGCELSVEPIPTEEHQYQFTDALAPTYLTQGCIDGIACTVCGDVQANSAYLLPELSAAQGDYGYIELGKLSHGEDLQAFYRDLDAAVTAFHLDTTTDLQEKVMPMGDGSEFRYYEACKVEYTSYGLSEDEVQMVWTVYRADRPLFYWISTETAWSETELYLLTDEAYALGEERSRIQTLLSDAFVLLMEEYYEVLESAPEGADEAYLTARFFHDLIISSMDYAYEDDGVTAREALWAHGILGFFENNEGVCESYARTFQLMLNYCGVENVLVIGEANGGGHAWNLARMGDGEWYWFDLTWDDQPHLPGGMIDTYFCKIDGEFDDHTPYSSENINMYFQCPLPDRADIPYGSVWQRPHGRDERE